MQLLAQLKNSVSDFPLFIETTLRHYLQCSCGTFQAGNISHSINVWKQLTSDDDILSTVMGMSIDFCDEPVQHYLPKSVRSKSEVCIITGEINKLLLKGVLEVTHHCDNEIISDIFLRDKKDGSHRMILNLKNLNLYAAKFHFKMDTLHTITKLIEKNCFMASIDLKDAYYSVPIAREDRKYLRFIWQDTLFQFTCLPNGLSCAPRKFTKLMKPALTDLHLRGYVSSAYIDDLYLQGQTYTDCVHNVIDSVTRIDSLGLVAHPDKSVFNPSQQLEFLGFILNSVLMTICLTPEKAAGLKTACQALLTNPSPTIRELARVVGKIVSSFPGVMYGPLYYRLLERDKIRALQINRWDFDKRVSLTPGAKSELSWWTTNVTGSHNVLTREAPTCTLTTDASKLGWGAVLGEQSTGGLWSSTENQKHINYLELFAAFLGLQTFCSSYHDCHIRLMIDNTTAVAVLNHMGTSHSDPLNELTKEIWLWCITRKIWISAAHIAGKCNVQSDSESRHSVTETEWMLNNTLLSNALNELDFTPEIDLFASRLNAQFYRYAAYRPDPGAWAVDAFTIDWSLLKFYAFPPFSVIPAVLKKIKEDKATGVCVLPHWPTQAWFPMVEKMAVCKHIVLPPSRSLLHLPNLPDQTHPLHRRLSLMVCLLSGKN